MRELVGLLSAEGENTGSSVPTSPSQLVVGVVSLVHFPAYSSPDLPVGVQAWKGTTPVREKQS